MTATLPEPGTRLVLTPGLRVVEHGRDGWQIGAEPSRRVRLERSTPTDQALALVATAAPVPADDAVRAVLGSLLAGGLVVALADLGTAGLTPTASALALQAPGEVAGRWARRRAARVQVVGSLGVDATPLLRDAGLGLTGTPTVALVVSSGELDRELLTPLMRAGTPHLVVRVLDGVGVLGPFVHPGRTACLHCLDLHQADEDPGSDARTLRYAAASARPRADGLPEPCDLAQATLLTAWAVRDLVTHVDGARPPTWSTTIRVEPDLATLTAVSWLRHSQCGCAWS